MKIETNTLNVLKNFAKINPSIVIQEGNTLRTMSPSKTIMGKATVNTEFDKRFAIYNLDRFISTISMFNNPEFQFKDSYVKILDENMESKLNYADESTITKLPEKEPKLPAVDATFKFNSEHLKTIERAAGVLQLPEIIVSGDGKNIHLQVADSKIKNGDVFSLNLGETDKTFKAVFKFENIKIIPGEYQVNISSRGLAHFLGKDVEYWIAIEQSSTF